jgi:hypothetical protein
MVCSDTDSWKWELKMGVSFTTGIKLSTSTVITKHQGVYILHVLYVKPATKTMQNSVNYIDFMSSILYKNAKTLHTHTHTCSSHRMPRIQPWVRQCNDCHHKMDIWLKYASQQCIALGTTRGLSCVRWMWLIRRSVIITSSLLMGLKEDCHHLQCWFHTLQLIVVCVSPLYRCQLVTWYALHEAAYFTAALAAWQASMTWHPTEDNTAASLIQVGHLTESHKVWLGSQVCVPEDLTN